MTTGILLTDAERKRRARKAKHQADYKARQLAIDPEGWKATRNARQLQYAARRRTEDPDAWREYQRVGKQKWRVGFSRRNPEKAREMSREKNRIYKLNRKRKALLSAPLAIIRAAELRGRELFERVSSATPRAWSFRDDVIGDVTMAYLTGKITLAGIPAAVQAAGRRYRNDDYKLLSLDVPLFDGSGATRLDMLTQDSMPWG